MSIDGSMSVEQKFSCKYAQKYTDICFQKAPRMQFLGVQIWCSANIFSNTKQKHVGKFVRFFEQNCIVK